MIFEHDEMVNGFFQGTIVVEGFSMFLFNGTIAIELMVLWLTIAMQCNALASMNSMKWSINLTNVNKYRGKFTHVIEVFLGNLFQPNRGPFWFHCLEIFYLCFSSDNIYVYSFGHLCLYKAYNFHWFFLWFFQWHLEDIFGTSWEYLGFLFPERSFGVSPVIYSNAIKGQLWVMILGVSWTWINW